ncbi:MAG: MFS transporter [Rhodospirillales bacterium]|nr:MFS transporter [Rhodospirillales bacterium]MDH3910715.1 MFS transporter [Rhodospirillales bacterium]MDH3919326.1 MFS transporter [Rhodospirillales bacterium]MDH3969314.1 MFS transporter [Rhodospirillales bacterium]
MRRDPTAKNVILLALCQALGMSCSALIITITALIGFDLAPNKGLATLPLALQFLAMMSTAAPASFFMRRFGRRAGFSLGAAMGCIAGGLGMQAIFAQSFPLFCASSILFGAFAAHVQFYRFAAADTASEAYRSRAISLVLAGGLLAAFLGPELAKWSRDLFAPGLYAGGYLCIVGLALISLLLLQFIEIPRPAALERRDSGRPLSSIARQPAFVVAVLSAMVGYGAMNLVMTATPLAVVSHNHSFEAAAFVIQWHVVGMYAPSFFTGNLIHRFGVVPILALGAVLVLGCVAVNLSGTEVFHFWTALVLLGLGWNFLFVGGTTLLTDCYRPEERAKAQALNEFLVFGTVTCTALLSGALYNALGWQAVNLGVIAPLVLVLCAVLWLGRRRMVPAA